jgi:8-oxo-dGTP pyrophosphatase MutT (NUDIX family)
MMELSVRAYIFDEDERVLMVRHSPDQPWVLPGGHVEENEHFYDALVRELDEELGIKITLVGAENDLSDPQVKSMPLPVSIHRVRYEHRNRGEVEKLEMFFFARLKGAFVDAKSEEIYEWERFESDDLIDMDSAETFPFIQEVLEQNIDLLELVG